MEKKQPTIKKLNHFERAGLACFLILFLASVGMTSYGQITHTDNLFWQFALVSLLSMMAGFLYGVNKPK